MLMKLGAYARKHHLALLALFFALGGTSFAASQALLPRNSVGTKQLRKNAVVSSKIKNNSVLGADVRESSLGKVPSAASADHATSANSANKANTAANANALGGTAASSFETQAQDVARAGQEFAVNGIASTSVVGDQRLTTVPGLGDFYVACSSSGGIQLYYKNTTTHGNFFWMIDGRGPSGGVNGTAAFLSVGERQYTNGFTPASELPVTGGPVNPYTNQVSTWLINSGTQNRWASVQVGVTRIASGCLWMIQGHVMG